MKFDTIIQNPPYKGSLHLDFFEKGLNLLSEKGKMVIVEPATWLINVRRNGKASRYDEIKKQIKGHVESVAIENLNNEFGTSQIVPFATTTIDMSKNFETIDFICFGEYRQVKSIYDCNFIGDYEIIQSIIAKCKYHGNMMKNHVTNKDKGEGNYYSKYIEINPYIGCAGGTSHKRESLEKYGYYNGFLGVYFSSCYFVNLFSDRNVNDIYSNIPKRLANGATYERPVYSESNSDCVYGTKEELENWRHFIFCNKLPLFLNIVLTIDQHNNSKEFIPWLVDRQYTDDEINKKFGFTDEEIRLMDITLKKYERNSPWFRRYMCGKDSATDKEVNDFIKEISKC